jgi:AAA domain
MIIFINGCFGVGKTSVANILCERIQESLIYDPEEVGFMLRNILTKIDTKEDFQDYAAWRRLVPIVAQQLIEDYHRTLIIPMTLWREDYFFEVTNGLKKVDAEFYHFCLVASAEVITSRLKARDNNKWSLRQVDTVVQALESHVFKNKIDVGHSSPGEIAAIILRSLNIVHKN